MTDARPEHCPTCRAEPGYAGGYCAPLRCYCGHDTCPAYAAGWRPAADSGPLAGPLPPEGAELARRAYRLQAERAREALRDAPHPDVRDPTGERE